MIDQYAFMPEFELDQGSIDQLANMTVDDFVRATIQYEVIGKSANTVRIRITNINIDPKKRIE